MLHGYKFAGAFRRRVENRMSPGGFVQRATNGHPRRARFRRATSRMQGISISGSMMLAHRVLMRIRPHGALPS
eukprot:8921146-Pyramimonas_sp.AAC.1